MRANRYTLAGEGSSRRHHQEVRLRVSSQIEPILSNGRQAVVTLRLVDILLVLMLELG